MCQFLKTNDLSFAVNFALNASYSLLNGIKWAVGHLMWENSVYTLKTHNCLSKKGSRQRPTTRHLMWENSVYILKTQLLKQKKIKTTTDHKTPLARSRKEWQSSVKITPTRSDKRSRHCVRASGLRRNRTWLVSDPPITVTTHLIKNKHRRVDLMTNSVISWSLECLASPSDAADARAPGDQFSPGCNYLSLFSKCKRRLKLPIKRGA